MLQNPSFCESCLNQNLKLGQDYINVGDFWEFKVNFQLSPQAFMMAGTGSKNMKIAQLRALLKRFVSSKKITMTKLREQAPKSS